MRGNWHGDRCWWMYIFPLWLIIVFMEMCASENLEKFLPHFMAENRCYKSSYNLKIWEEISMNNILFIVIRFEVNKWSRKPRPKRWQQWKYSMRKQLLLKQRHAGVCQAWSDRVIKSEERTEEESGSWCHPRAVVSFAVLLFPCISPAVEWGLHIALLFPVH